MNRCRVPAVMPSGSTAHRKDAAMRTPTSSSARLRLRLLAPLAVAAVAATACGGSSGGQAQVAAQPSAASSASDNSAAGGYGYSVPTGAATASGASAGAATVQTTSAALGTFLTDAKGKTLYLFEKDKGSTSTCNDACASVWPPLLSGGTPQAKGSADASKLGTTKRADGSTQVTYAGHPLYYYAPDTAAGDTKGEGVDSFGAEWYVVSPAGSKVEAEGRS